MEGEARAVEHGAATIVSAIGSFYGVTLGVSLETSAHVVLGKGERTIITIDGGESDTRLVSECVRRARASGVLKGGVTVDVSSEIPPSRGMKSSSSVSLAVTGALMKAAGRRITPRELLVASAESSIAAGVSITGAYDDAAACHFGGLIFADNRRMRTVRRLHVRGGYSVLFCVPERRITKESLPMERIRRHASAMKLFFDQAKRGGIGDACRGSTMLLCGLLDIDPSPALEAMNAGALISGLTGTGPAFFAVAGNRTERRVAAAMSGFGKVMRTRPTGVSADGYAF